MSKVRSGSWITRMYLTKSRLLWSEGSINIAVLQVERKIVSILSMQKRAG